MPAAAKNIQICGSRSLPLALAAPPDWERSGFMMVWKFFTLFPPSHIQLRFPSQVARTRRGGRNLLSIFMVQARPPDKLNFSISGSHSGIYTLHYSWAVYPLSQRSYGGLICQLCSRERYIGFKWKPRSLRTAHANFKNVWSCQNMSPCLAAANIAVS